MTPRFLLDTDVLIWHLRGHEPTETLLKDIEVEQPLGCSTVSVFEVWAGVRRQEERVTRQFLAALCTIPIDAPVAFRAAEYWREFRGQGVTLGRADAFIAATAHMHRLVLVTYNRSHYPMEDITFYELMPRIQ